MSHTGDQAKGRPKRKCPFCNDCFTVQGIGPHVKKCEREREVQEVPGASTEMDASRAMVSKSNKDKIARSPTPPDTDEDEGEDVEWPVHGIVGEDVDVFGISSFEIRWKNWSRADGTNTTWQRDFEGDPALVDSWNDAMKHQRLRKAAESQSIDLTQLASTPMHDRLTFERAQAVEEKAAERARRNGGVACPGKKTYYQGWMAEVDRQVAHHERNATTSGAAAGGTASATTGTTGRGERPSPFQSQSFSSPSSSSPSSAVPKKRGRPLVDQEGPHAESSRSTVSQKRRVSRRNKAAARTASDGDTDTIDSEL